MENKKLLSISVIILAMSIVFGSIWIGNSIAKSLNSQASIFSSNSATIESKVLTLSQVAEYLNMSEDDVLAIIETEKMQLDKTNNFNGKMFPYFTVNDIHYFYKDEIDEWLREVACQRRQYNTLKGLIFQ